MNRAGDLAGNDPHPAKSLLCPTCGRLFGRKGTILHKAMEAEIRHLYKPWVFGITQIQKHLKRIYGLRVSRCLIHRVVKDVK